MCFDRLPALEVDWRFLHNPRMSDAYQIDIPQSFIALYVPAGRSKSSEPRDVVAARYELCEDMANMLTETASTMLFSLGLTETDVLRRCRQGLAGDQKILSDAEANWVLYRLAELLNWREFLAPSHC